MNQNLFARLRSDREFMTKTEKRIADLLLQEPRAFLSGSMAELASHTGTSQGSINNFSKKYADGFSNLKLLIAASMGEEEPKPFALIDRSMGVRAAMELKIEENLAAFRNTLAINSEEALQRSVQMILSARRVEIYGLFLSGVVARDLCFQLIQLGIPASFVSDTLMFSVSASTLGQKDLAIAVSSSGFTKDILDAVRIARDKNTPVLALTCNQHSPLAAAADTVLLTASSGMSVSDRRDEVLMAQLLVLDTLCSYIRTSLAESSEKRYYQLAEIIGSHSIKD